MSQRDEGIRLAAVEHCKRLASVWGEAVPFKEIKNGFLFENQRIQLVGPQGIFKPKELEEGPLTLTSTIGSPYQDEHLQDENVISYDYAPPSREYENAATRRHRCSFTPLIYFRQVSETPSEYVIVAPIYIADDDPGRRKFTLSAVPASLLPLPKQAEQASETPADRPLLQKAYRERTVRERLHQSDFRRQVLQAYRTRCAVCELRMRTLLDGAHITPDSDSKGEPVIQNGLSLCTLHHRAFDQDILLITPDYSVHVGKVSIDADDQAAAQNIRAFEGKQLWLPKQEELWPDPDRLKARLHAAS
jgi:putative restriction endonuclease